MFSPMSHCLISIISTVRERAQWILIKLLQEDIYAYLKNWSFWTVLLEKTLESPLDCKEIQPVHSEGDQPWDFFGGNDAEAETPVLWPPHVKSWLIGKDSDAGRDWGQEEKGTTGWDGWMASPTRWTWVWASSRSWWWTGKAWSASVHGVAKSQTWLSDWTELNWSKIKRQCKG